MNNLKEKISRLRSRSEQVSADKAEANKYIVIVFDGREQVISFPNHVQHADVFNYTKREAPNVELVSAGFFIATGDALWVGGESFSLETASRPQDTALRKSFLASPDRQPWDLTQITVNGGAQ